MTPNPVTQPVLAVLAALTGADVELSVTYAYESGPAHWGPYSREYAAGMAMVLMEMGETDIRLFRTTTYRRPDGSTYRVQVEIDPA